MSSQNTQQFSRKVWITGGIFAFIASFLLLVKATFNVLLLLIAASLIAVLFRACGGLIHRKTGWNKGWSVAAAVVGTAILAALFFWLVGAKVQSQTSQLANSIPKIVQSVKEQIQQTDMGQNLLNQISSANWKEKVIKGAETFFKTTFGFLGDFYVILILGIYLTVNPLLYNKGIVRLIPPKGRDKASQTLSAVGTDLKKWLKGQLMSMVVIFTLTAIGLVIIGVPMWLTLAIIAGLLNFIPNFGPLMSAVPAVLLAFSISPATALWVIGLYIVVQTLEGSLITPQIQQKMVHVPPALLIFWQVVIAALTGFWGIVLAAPLLVIVMALVRELYVKQVES